MRLPSSATRAFSVTVALMIAAATEANPHPLAEAVRPQTEQERIHAALEKHNGDVAAAAKEVGLAFSTVRMKIHDSPDLKLRWTKNPQDEIVPPDDIAGFSPKPITTDDRRLAQAIEKENKRVLREGLESLPLSKPQVEMALALQAFNRNHFSTQLEIVNAGITMTVVQLMTDINSTRERLQGIRNELLNFGSLGSEERERLCKEEYQIAQELIAEIDLLRKIQGESFRGNQILALIRYKLKGGGTKKMKPAFQTIDSSVEESPNDNAA